MDNTKITIIINGNHYHLKSGDEATFADIQAADRTDLLALLKSIESYQAKHISARAVKPTASIPSQATVSQATVSQATASSSSLLTPAQKQQLHDGDVENLAAQIMMQHKRADAKKSSKGSRFPWWLMIIVAGCVLAWLV